MAGCAGATEEAEPHLRRRARSSSGWRRARGSRGSTRLRRRVPRYPHDLPELQRRNRPDAKFCFECGSASPGRARTVIRRQPTPASATSAVRQSRVRHAAAPPSVAEPTAERRLVSVLFADLVGFTTLSESRDAEEVRELLSRYFDTCRRLIELYGGTVEKFIGDAVMAVWGTPTATEDDAERAVRAALDLVAAVSALGQEVGAAELRARAGVLTGEAAVTLGAEGEGMVAGDLVNTASRVQSVAEPGNVSRRRVDAPRDGADDRLRGRGRVRAEGQGGADAALAGAARRLRRRAARSSRRGSRRRSSAATASCARSRTSSTPAPRSRRRTSSR